MWWNYRMFLLSKKRFCLYKIAAIFEPEIVNLVFLDLELSGRNTCNRCCWVWEFFLFVDVCVQFSSNDLCLWSVSFSVGSNGKLRKYNIHIRLFLWLDICYIIKLHNCCLTAVQETRVSFLCWLIFCHWFLLGPTILETNGVALNLSKL